MTLSAGVNEQPLNLLSELSLRVHATNSRTCGAFRLRDIRPGHKKRNIMRFRDTDDQYRIPALQHALYDRSIAGMAKLPISAYVDGETP